MKGADCCHLLIARRNQLLVAVIAGKAGEGEDRHIDSCLVHERKADFGRPGQVSSRRPPSEASCGVLLVRRQGRREVVMMNVDLLQLGELQAANA